MREKLENLKTSDSKEYWKLLKKKGRDKKQPNIPVGELFEFFKILNTPSNREHENNSIDHMILDVDVSNLN